MVLEDLHGKHEPGPFDAPCWTAPKPTRGKPVELGVHAPADALRARPHPGVMPELELPECPVVPELPDPRLSGTVDGVEFWLRLARGHAMRCVITDGALQRHYGATGEPASWIRAFLRHHADIAGRALAASARRDDVHVVLLNDATGALKAVAGRCVS